MTDNEIIKALECCRECKCKECPCYKNIEGEMRCTEIDEEEILDIINRQKAEIERLQNIIVGFMDEVGTWSNKYEVDISTIHKLPLLAKEDFNIRNKIKSEAIKEFWEKVKQGFQGVKHILPTAYLIGDKIVKEMTEQTIFFEKVEHNSLCETETYKGSE